MKAVNDGLQQGIEQWAASFSALIETDVSKLLG